MAVAGKMIIPALTTTPYTAKQAEERKLSKKESDRKRNKSCVSKE